MDSIISPNMREFWQQEAHDPQAMAKRIAFLVEHPGVIDALDKGELVTTKPDREWTELFGHIRAVQGCRPHNQFNLPLEFVDEDEKEREVISRIFTDTAMGRERLAWAKANGLKLAGNRATGVYLKHHPIVDRAVVGGRFKDSSESLPVWALDLQKKPCTVVMSCYTKHFSFDTRFVGLFESVEG